MKTTILTLLSLGLLSVTEAAVFPSKGAVNELTSKTWKNKLNDGNLAIVAFTAPWCGHCKTLAPEFLKAAESLNPLIPFHNVNCDEEDNKPLCNAEGVQGFPTIKAYTKSTKSKGRTYERERTAGAIISWATDQVPLTKVTKLKNVAELEPWKAAKPDQPHALLIHPSNPSVPLMWKVLSDRLSDKIHFGFIKDDKGEAKRSIGIETEDAKVDGVKVVTFTVDGDARVYGAGPLKFEALLNHFKKVASGDVSGASVEDNQAYETVYETTVISTPTASAVPVSTENKAAKRRDAQAKWEEEERRDRLRREKREQERLARMFEDQERVTDEQDAQEDSGPQAVTPVQEAADPLQPADASMTAQLSDQTTAPDPVVPEEPGQIVLEAVETLRPSHDEAQSPETPLDAASEDFNYGVSDSNDHTEKHNDQSAATPLEEEAEEFEHGQHKAVLDESPTEERIKDEL